MVVSKYIPQNPRTAAVMDQFKRIWQQHRNDEGIEAKLIGLLLGELKRLDNDYAYLRGLVEALPCRYGCAHLLALMDTSADEAIVSTIGYLDIDHS